MLPLAKRYRRRYYRPVVFSSLRTPSNFGLFQSLPFLKHWQAGEQTLGRPPSRRCFQLLQKITEKPKSSKKILAIVSTIYWKSSRFTLKRYWPLYLAALAERCCRFLAMSISEQAEGRRTPSGDPACNTCTPLTSACSPLRRTRPYPVTLVFAVSSVKINLNTQKVGGRLCIPMFIICSSAVLQT